MLYDLTNTYFSGQAHLSPGQVRRSKQKRHDCPLVTLGLCLDEADWFVAVRYWRAMCRNRRHWRGRLNVSEPVVGH